MILIKATTEVYLAFLFCYTPIIVETTITTFNQLVDNFYPILFHDFVYFKHLNVSFYPLDHVQAQ